ncbi:hypothetical protein CAMRE0001_0790 [Campylobacter rectus RM3267]|uniref:Uncharacterized protein n=1 Tax=Campylobacter rectus RM3267 TaxID=553218 RepID=B9CZU6_CAMRE|nr:hypothetical protein CAMRE0001_0790 [Campylobacter rectus RM3267]
MANAKLKRDINKYRFLVQPSQANAMLATFNQASRLCKSANKRQSKF